MRKIMLLGALFASACGAPDADRGPSDAAYIQVAKDEVAKRLKDPASAQYEEVRVSRKSGVVAICGYVNSKNSFGGYTGRQRFISGGATALEEDFAPGELEVAWARAC